MVYPGGAHCQAHSQYITGQLNENLACKVFFCYGLQGDLRFCDVILEDANRPLNGLSLLIFCEGSDIDF